MCDRCNRPDPTGQRAYEAVCNACGGRAVAVLDADGAVVRAYHPTARDMSGGVACPALTTGVDLPLDGVQAPPVMAALLTDDALIAELERRGVLQAHRDMAFGIITGPDHDPYVLAGDRAAYLTTGALRARLNTEIWPEGARLARSVTRWSQTPPLHTWESL